MTEELLQFDAGVRTWADAARQAGLLNADSHAQLLQGSQDTPESLFDAASQRPLVVALFGGTGVGKSTLMNRLAGEAVARTSVERPTSRNVTLYHHETVQVNLLAGRLPVERIQTRTHGNDAYRSVVWIDMPDYDSIDQTNRELVTEWLPHIDMLVYVVSPERYRDDQGWRLLQEHGNEHAWVFVINHWDRGNPRQRDDFQSLLSETGIENPYLFCTDSSSDADKPNGDEFETLQQTVLEFANRKTIEQLQTHGVLVRVESASQRLRDGIAATGAPALWDNLLPAWQQWWPGVSNDMVDSLDWKYARLSQPWADHEPGFFRSLLASIMRRPQQPAEHLPSLAASDVLDEDDAERIDDLLQRFISEQAAAGLPAAALKRALTPVPASLPTHAAAHIPDNLERSVASPGTPRQQQVQQVLGWLVTALPIAAALWAVYTLISRYVVSTEFLGFNFATHSLMLVGLAWFIPWFLRLRLRPTLRAAAARGLRSGVADSLQQVGSEAETALQALTQQQAELVTQAETNLAQARAALPDSTEAASDTPVSDIAAPALDRVLIPGRDRS